MWPDYSCCDFCIYADLDLLGPGTVCENCETIEAERRRNRMMVSYETDCEQEVSDEDS